MRSRLVVPYGAVLVLIASAATHPVLADGYTERGQASWYGGKFHGRQTASGEIFDKGEMTAAHRTLPFGTVLRVTNEDTGRQALVRINDRGPFARGRILDCSERAADELGFRLAGTAKVKIETLGRAGGDDGRLTKKERRRIREQVERANRSGAEALPPGAVSPVDEEAGEFELQVGAFRDEGNARRLAERLRGMGHGARLLVTSDGFTRVRVGPYRSRRDAETAIASIAVEEIPFVVRRD